MAETCPSVTETSPVELSFGLLSAARLYWTGDGEAGHFDIITEEEVGPTVEKREHQG